MSDDLNARIEEVRRDGAALRSLVALIGDRTPTSSELDEIAVISARIARAAHLAFFDANANELRASS